MRSFIPNYIVFSILICRGVLAAEPSPGFYYDDIDVAESQTPLSNKQLCVEKATDEVYLLESARARKAKTGKTDAEIKAIKEEIKAMKAGIEALIARNLASVTLIFRVLDKTGVVLKEGRQTLKAPYRKYRKTAISVDETLFISSEDEEILQPFKELDAPPMDALIPFIAASHDLATNKKAKMDADYNNFNAYLRERLFQKTASEKSSKTLIDGRRDHCSDTEQQILRVLNKKYEGILYSFIKESETICSAQETSLSVRCVLHTKMDPCPFCLHELNSYFTADFPKVTGSTLSKLNATGTNISSFFLFPIVSSRMELKYQSYQIRLLLPWKPSVNIADFSFEMADVSIDEEEVVVKTPTNFGLILYAVPYGVLKRAVEWRLLGDLL